MLIGISIIHFRPTGNIRRTVSECKVQSSFQCSVLPRVTEGVSFTLSGEPKARTAAFPTDSSDTFPSSPSLVAEICSVAARLPRWQGQQADPPYHGPEESPAQMALGQEQPIITTMLHQPTARLH